MTKTTDAGPLEEIVRQIVDDSLLFADERSPFKAQCFDGRDPKMCLIVGENASGKSLFFQMIAQFANRRKIMPITISIRERTGAGTHEMGGMRRIMMFGDESEQSTGATSANVVANGFHNANRDTPAILLLDEPELGLSDGYARAMGHFIAKQFVEASATCVGVVVVTHSRSLVDGLVMSEAVRPLFVHLGDQPKDLLAWMEDPEVRSLDDLMNLREVASDRRKQVYQLLNSKDKA